MVIYLLYVASPIIVFFAVTLFRDLTNPNSSINKNTCLIICGIIMTLMIGLRHYSNGSGDTRFYYLNWEMMSGITFRQLPSTLEEIDLEKGYLIAVWLLSRVFKDPQWALFLSGVFFSVSVCRFVKHNCNSSPIALVMFNSLGIFNFMVQGLRQAIAMSICLWSLEFAKERKWIKFFLIIGLAATFHASAIVYAVVFILIRFKINLQSILIFVICSSLGLLILPRLIEIVNKAINDEYDMNSASESGGIVAIFIYIAIIAFGFVFHDKGNKNFSLYIYLALIGFACMIMRNSINQIIERVAHYFAFGQMAIVSNAVNTLENKTTRIVTIIVICLLCLAVAAYKASYSTLIPYNFMWY